MKAIPVRIRTKARLPLAVGTLLAVVALSVSVPLVAFAAQGGNGGGGGGGGGGNNGETKLLQAGTLDPIDANDPHLDGCDFVLQWDGFTNQTSVTFRMSGTSPTGSDANVVYPATTVALTNGTAQYPIEFTPANLASMTPSSQGYHITLVGDVTDATSNGKNKTFWVEKACGIPGLSIDKSSNPSTITQGAQSTFTINVWNPGSGEATNVVVTDDLPAGLTYVSDDETSCTHSSGTITCNVGTLAANGTATSGNFNVEVIVTGTTAGTYTNTGQATSNSITVTDTAPLTVDPLPDPPDTNITKSTGASPIDEGGQSTFTLNVWNSGEQPATGVTISDPLPAGLTYVSDDEASCAHSGGTITCTVGTLAANGSPTSGNFDVDIVVEGTTPGNYTNTATVDSNELGPESDDSTLNVREVRKGQPNTNITKSSDPGSITEGAQSTFTINVWNSGDEPATDVTITDALPAGLTYVSDDEASCTQSSGTITCTVGTLAANGTSTSGNFDVEIVVLGTTAGDYLNVAVVDSDELDSEQAQAELDVNPIQSTPTPTPTVSETPPPPGPGPVPFDDNGTLIVEKQTLPDGATETFSFSGDVSATLGDGQTSTRSVDPGTYTVTEAAADGWSLTSITCTDSNSSGQASTGDLASKTATFLVSPNETVRCVFTNTEDEVLPKPPVEKPDDEDPTKPPVDEPEEKDDEVLPKQVKSGALPFTGTDPYGLVSLAGMLITAGGSLVLINRRRKY